MAWRIDEHVIRGEIDSRIRGKVTGRIWFTDRDEPVVLELEGSPCRDLAGHLLRFTNPEPKPGIREGFMNEQYGVVGDITASRKVKVPDVSMDEVLECYEKKKPFPWHWGNSLYLEWFSLRNGRVVIETATFTLELDHTAAWSMSEEEEAVHRRANAEAMSRLMDRMVAMTSAEKAANDDDAPRSQAEVDADDDAARMDLLLDRVQARIKREGRTDFARILEEERARLKKERGETTPAPTPEQEAERQRWVEEMNAICAEAIEEGSADDWKEDEQHPLVERCSELAIRLHHDVGQWLPVNAPEEHPLLEITFGTRFAAAKLGGALESSDEWPPDKQFAGDVLVGLKKARECLRDVLAGLESADQESLAEPVWRAYVRKHTGEILSEVEKLVAEVREVLKDEG